MRIGSYTVVRELARGAMGVVYVARHDELERDVALKVMLSGGKKVDPKLLKRFELEAQTVAQLNHPNIVRVHEVGKDEKDNPYLVMDLIQGDSLYHQVKQQGPLEPRAAAALAKTLAEALEHAHSRKILHRDVKPANVLIDAAGAPHLTDFGLARAEADDDQRLTHQGQWLGTPGYMPPEQAKGELQKVDRRADVYGLGATLFAMLSGRPPFERETEHETLKAVTAESAPQLRTLRAGIDPELEAICAKCLQKEPSARYDTAQALADDLDRYLRDEPVEARPARAGDRLGKWVRRNRALVVTAVLALLVLSSAAGGFYGLVLLPEQRAQAVLTDHEAWAAEHLEPWALGTLPGRDLPEDVEALTARLRRLEAAVAQVGAGKHRDGLTLLRAAVRLQRGRAGEQVELPDEVDAQREAADLVVDALLLLRRDDAAAARARLDLALQRQRGLQAAQLADLHLRARLEPARFLIRASTLEGDAAGLARSLAGRAASALFTAAFTDAAADPAPLSRAEMRRLRQARERAGELGVSSAAILEAKQEALEASTPAWSRALEAAAERRRERSVLLKLSTLLALEPVSRAGPGLRALLDQHLLQLLDREASAVERGNTDAAYQRARRIARIEHTIFYRLDPRRRHPLRMYQVLQSTRNAQQSSRLGPELTLACFRYGVFDRSHPLRTADARLDRLLEPYPASRVRRARVWVQRMQRRSARSELETRAGELQALLSDGLEDLSVRYWPSLIRRMLSAARGAYASKRRQLATRALALLRRCRQSLEAAHPYEQTALLFSLQLEAEATLMARGRSAQLQAYLHGADYLRERLGAAAGRDRVLAMELLSRFLIHVARVQGDHFGQREQAVKLCYEALEQAQSSLGFFDGSNGRAAGLLYLATTLRSLGRAPEALKAIERHATGEPSLQLLILRIELKAEVGERDAADALLREALQGADGDRRRLLLLLQGRLARKKAKEEEPKEPEVEPEEETTPGDG